MILNAHNWKEGHVPSSTLFGGWDLGDADFRGADLRCSDFLRATWTGPSFEGALFRWCSRDILAKNPCQWLAMFNRLSLAAANNRLIVMQRRWGWDDYIAIDHPLR